MRILRVVGVLVVVGVAVAGFGYAVASRSAPTTNPAPPVSGTPVAPAGGATTEPAATSTAPPRQDVAAGSEGLTVRYADSDGSVKTLRVEDFRR